MLENKVFVWFHSTLIGREVKHSRLQEGKIMQKIAQWKWYPSLKQRMLHLYFTGVAKRLLWGKVFSASFSLFSFTKWLRRSLRLSILNHNFCSGLTAAPTSSFQHQAWYGVAASPLPSHQVEHPPFQHQALYGVAGSPLPSHQVDLSGDVIPSGAWKRNQIGGSSLMYCARWSLLKNEKSLK